MWPKPKVTILYNVINKPNRLGAVQIGNVDRAIGKFLAALVRIINIQSTVNVHSKKVIAALGLDLHRLRQAGKRPDQRQAHAQAQG